MVEIMLSPHELRNKEFAHAMRGYSPAEVDEHINFILEKYTELYRANDELEKRLRQQQAQLDTYKNDEASIRGALVNAQRAATQIVEEANERADVIMRTAKTDCDRILASFREQARKEKEELLRVRSAVRRFKEELFTSYQTHIEMIEQLIPADITEDEFTADDNEIVRGAIDTIKRDIASGTSPDGGAGADIDQLGGIEGLSEIVDPAVLAALGMAVPQHPETETETEAEADADAADTDVVEEEQPKEIAEDEIDTGEAFADEPEAVAEIADDSEFAELPDAAEAEDGIPAYEHDEPTPEDDISDEELLEIERRIHIPPSERAAEDQPDSDGGAEKNEDGEQAEDDESVSDTIQHLNAMIKNNRGGGKKRRRHK